jgi:preprotein translocase subunit SecG
MSGFYNILIVLHVFFVVSIVFLVILQRSSESNVLVSSYKFRPGEVGNVVAKVLYFLIFAFCVNSVVMLHAKKSSSKLDSSSGLIKELEKNNQVPVS